MVTTRKPYTLAELRALAARLDRESEQVPVRLRSARMSELSRELAVLAARSLHRRELTAEADAYSLDIPWQQAWALARAMSGDPARGFSSFEELLTMVGAGPAPRATVRPVGTSPVRSSRSRGRRGGRLPPAFALLLLLVAVGGGLWSRSPAHRLSEPALLVAEGTSVAALAHDGSTRGRFELGERIGGLGCDRDTVFVSLPDSHRVARIALATGQRLSDLAVGAGAGSLCAAPDGAWLAVAYPGARKVKLWLPGAAAPSASASVAGSPSALTGLGRSLFIRLQSGRVLELAVPSLRQVPGAPTPPPFPPLTRAWWPGP